MKAKRRQELKTNELAQWLVDKWAWINARWNYIAGVALVLILAIGLLWYWRSSRRSLREEGLNALTSVRSDPQINESERLDKIRQISAQYADDVVQRTALEVLAQEALRQFQMAGPSEDAKKREELLGLAEQSAQQILGGDGSDPGASGRAHLWLAAVAENRGQKDEARKHYKAIVDTPELAAVTLYQSQAVARERTLDGRMEPVTILPALPKTQPTTTQAATTQAVATQSATTQAITLPPIGASTPPPAAAPAEGATP